MKFSPCIGVIVAFGAILVSTPIYAQSPADASAQPTISMNSANPAVVRGTQAAFRATVTPGATLVSWTANGPGGVTFSPNGTGDSSTTVAAFSNAGHYTINVTAVYPGGQFVSTASSFDVISVPNSLTVLPAKVTVPLDHIWFFRGIVKDQFYHQMTALIPTWAVTQGYGTIQNGHYHSPNNAEIDTITASYGDLRGVATVIVSNGQ